MGKLAATTSAPNTQSVGAWLLFALVLLGCALLWRVMSTRWFARRVVGRATPGTLGAIRVYVCIIAATMTLLERTGSIPRLPEADRRPMGVIDYFYTPLQLDFIARHQSALTALKCATIAALLCAAAGLRTRTSLAVSAILWLILAGIVRSYTRFTHNGLIPFYLLVLLCFTPASHAFSIDRLFRIRRGLPVPPLERKRLVYAWARFAIWVLLALPYVIAGLSKLRYGGWDWWQSANMQAILVRGAFRPHDRPYDHVLELLKYPAILFSFMGIYTLATEIGIGLAPFWKPARRVLPIMTVGMHLAVYYLQRIRFWDMMVLQALYYDWSPIARYLTRRFPILPGGAELGGAARSSSAAPYRSEYPRIVRLAPTLVTLIIMSVLGWWALRIEWFPLTSMRMYAEINDTGVVEYYRVYQTDVTGNTHPAYLEKMSRDAGVFHLTLWNTFTSPATQTRCINMLRFCGEQWNARCDPHERVVRIDIEKRRWDYVNNLQDPARGHVINQLSVPIKSPSIE